LEITQNYTCNHETSSSKSQNSWEVYKINVGERITLGKMRNGMKNGSEWGKWGSAESKREGGEERNFCGVLECEMMNDFSPL